MCSDLQFPNEWIWYNSAVVFGVSLILAVGVVASNVLSFAVASVDRRIALTSSSDVRYRFVDYRANAAKDEFVPNPNFWLKDVNFSCVSPWNSGGGSMRAGTLISKRHIIFAKHFPLWKGVRIVFVDNEGEVCPLNIEATKSVEKTDIMIGLLNYEVTPNIRPARILPEDYKDYIGDGRGLPFVVFNQSEQAFLSECYCASTWHVRRADSAEKTWQVLGGKIVVGDSGNPAFLLIGNEPILLCCLQTGGFVAGPSVSHHRRAIQAVMDELCPGYKLEEFDFSQVKMKSDKLRDEKL